MNELNEPLGREVRPLPDQQNKSREYSALFVLKDAFQVLSVRRFYFSDVNTSHARRTKIASSLVNGRMNPKRQKLIHQTPAEAVRNIDPPIVPSKQ